LGRELAMRVRLLSNSSSNLILHESRSRGINVCDSSNAHTAFKATRRNSPRNKGERTKHLRAQQHEFFLYDPHSTQQQAAAARSTPPSRFCYRLSSTLLHSANRAETLPEKKLRLEASILKRALLVACKVRFHHGSALGSLNRCEALLGPFRMRKTAPKFIHS